MKITIELPDDLMIAAKKTAQTRTTLREIFERGFRRELGGSRSPQSQRNPAGPSAG